MIRDFILAVLTCPPNSAKGANPRAFGRGTAHLGVRENHRSLVTILQEREKAGRFIRQNHRFCVGKRDFWHALVRRMTINDCMTEDAVKCEPLSLVTGKSTGKAEQVEGTKWGQVTGLKRLR